MLGNILTTSAGGSPRKPLHGFVNDLYIKCVKSVLFILNRGISERPTKFETVSRRDLYNKSILLYRFASILL